MGSIQGITIERSVLLFEIERRCSFEQCNERNFIGLTKLAALEYNGFECGSCERWNPDCLKQTDIPEWWAEIQASKNPLTDSLEQ
jgi:hypothetical protein